MSPERVEEQNSSFSRSLPSVASLRAALEDDDEPRVLLIALRRIAKARGGIAKVAKAGGIERDARVGRTFLSDVFSF